MSGRRSPLQFRDSDDAEMQERIMTTTFAWLLLFVAGALEIAWAIGIKYTDGFTRMGPSVFTMVTAAASFFLLAQVVKTIPVGTAYAVWGGIGAVGVAVVGILAFNESMQWTRLLFLSLIIVGIVGLKVQG
jgi:quaternary ammonium compound-resistance protein SugE